MASGGAAEATPARDQNNVSPMDSEAHAGAHNGNQSSFEEGDDNVKEKGAAAAGGLTFWQKTKRHFGRFKWWYLLALIILLAILLPIM